MIAIKQVCGLTLVACLLSGCATIFSPTSYKVKINSVPRESVVTIYNRKGIEIFSDTTPCEVRLKTSAGYFRRAIYSLEFNKDGYVRSNEEITAKVNSLYYGNILFGGWVGLLIVDPLTGAMYTINKRDIIQVLTPR